MPQGEGAEELSPVLRRRRGPASSRSSTRHPALQAALSSRPYVLREGWRAGASSSTRRPSPGGRGTSVLPPMPWGPRRRRLVGRSEVSGLDRSGSLSLSLSASGLSLRLGCARAHFDGGGDQLILGGGAALTPALLKSVDPFWMLVFGAMFASSQSSTGSKAPGASSTASWSAPTSSPLAKA